MAFGVNLKLPWAANPLRSPKRIEDKGLYSPQKSEPVDLLFVKKFTASGGKFLYCEKESDAYDFIAEISRESALQKLYCDDPSLRSILSKAGFRDLAEHVEQADAFCSTCEYLVSFNGGIMITARQTKGKKLKRVTRNLYHFCPYQPDCTESESCAYRYPYQVSIGDTFSDNHNKRANPRFRT